MRPEHQNFFLLRNRVFLTFLLYQYIAVARDRAQKSSGRKIFKEKDKNSYFCFSPVHSSQKGEQRMENKMQISTGPPDTVSDEELTDALIAISVVARQLAEKLRKKKDKGGRKNEQDE